MTLCLRLPDLQLSVCVWKIGSVEFAVLLGHQQLRFVSIALEAASQ